MILPFIPACSEQLNGQLPTVLNVLLVVPDE